MIAEAIKDLKPNPQDTSAFYLENIYQLLADPNVSRVSVPSNLVTPPPFSPPGHAVWVNSLWFLSLAISLTSALLATLLQQWSRRFVKVTQSREDPQERARVRAFIFEGIDKSHLLWVSDTVPTLLHLSLILFFAGLLILLLNTSHTVFFAVVWWVGLCTGLYTYITLLPIFRPYSLHYGPFASIGWQLYANRRHVLRKALSIVMWPCYKYTKDNHPERLLGRIERNTVTEASKPDRSREIDASILDSTIDSLHDDHDKEQFFEAIPGFYYSEVGKNCCPRQLFSNKFLGSLDEFLDRTLSSDSISEWVRSTRLFVSLNAANVAVGPDAGSKATHRIIFNENWHEVPPSPETRYILTRWAKSNSQHTVASGKCIVARIIAKGWKRDETWMALAMDQLGVSEDVLKDYLTHGNSVLLANLIKITRLFFENKFPYHDVLGSVSEFSVEDILPALRQEFCTLWNEIVQDAKFQSSNSTFILGEICGIFKALHPGDTTAPTPTDKDCICSASDYASCLDPTHLTSHEPIPTARTTYQTVPHHGTVLATIKPSIYPSTTTTSNSSTTLQPGNETTIMIPLITPDTSSSSVAMLAQPAAGKELSMVLH